MKILFTLLAIILGGCATRNTYELTFNYKPLNHPYDMNGTVKGAGLRDLGRDWTWIINTLKDRFEKNK